MAFQAAGSAFDDVGDRRRQGGIQYRIASLAPGSVQRSEPRRGEGVSGMVESLLVVCVGASSSEEVPPEFIEDDRPQRTGKLLAKRGAVRGGDAGQVRWKEESNRPGRKAAERFG